MASTDRGLEYVGLEEVKGPLVFVEAVRDVGYGEVAEIRDAEGTARLGTVLEVSGERAVVQVLEGTSGLASRTTRVRFLGTPVTLAVSRDMLGRVFDGLGRPIDGGPAPLTGEHRDINGQPINPFSREYPRDFIQTGISAIDGMNTLVRGQKLPIFSGNGLPHDRIAAQITRQAKLLDQAVEFVVVFAAMGVKHDVAHFFTRSFEESGVLQSVAVFQSLASAPSIERLLTPRAALTLADIVRNGGTAEREAYLSFLQGGCSKYPIDLLRNAGVDVTTPQPITTAIERFGDLTNQLISIELN